ncbi:Ig-like domain-containing protein [Falsiroseomonas oryzae]|uniref:Ig-like domain-containing protein n=1 Tax=Falsiroseomonas oryzae TaxID=2766473 RepID=UPI0022EA93EB|nr:Ig-like domain-containing protein [Roseomonas sp. MO-31]
MVNVINGSPDADTLPGLVDAPDSILGGDGPDSIDGQGAGTGNADQIFGEAGDDTLVSSGTGFANLDGGNGNDRLIAGSSGIESVVGGEGDDTLIGDAGTNYLAGDDYDIFGAPPSASSGNDVIDGGGGDDVVSGGPGNDTLSPGAATNLPAPADISGGFDLVFGGDGDDVLALAGAPQDYEIRTDPIGGVPFLVSIPSSGPGSGVNAIVEDVEFVAFGVTPEQLAAGATPLTVVDYLSLFDFSSNAGAGRPHWSFSDTVQGAAGASQVLIAIGDLLANDFDPDGDTLILNDLLPVAGAGIASFEVLLTAADIDAAGFASAAYPDGLLVVNLDAPLVNPLRFTYRTQMQIDGTFFVDLGSQATVTIAAPSGPPGVADDSFRGNIGGEIVIPFAALLANDSGVSIIDASYFPPSDGSYLVAIDRIFELFRVYHYGGAAQSAEFFYTAQDADGNLYNANVTIDIGNTQPDATDQTLYVQPGVANTFEWADIVRIAAHADPDGDPLTLAFYNGSGTSAFGTLTGFGDADLGGITFTPVAGYTGGFSIQYAITDLPDLGGAQSQPNLRTATLTFAVAEPIAAQDDGPLVATIGRYGFITGNRLMANDDGNDIRIVGLLDDRGTADTDDDLILPTITTAQGTLVGLQNAAPGSTFGPDGSTQLINLNPLGSILGQGSTYAGPDTFTYVIEDAAGVQDRATVTLSIANTSPVAVNDDLVFTPGGGTTSLIIPIASILANDSDIDTGQILALTGFANQNQAGEGRLEYVAGPPGTVPTELRYTPRDPTWTGTETFQYFISDKSDPGGTLSGSASALIRVTVGAAPPPVFAITATGPTSVAEGTDPSAPNAFTFTVTRTSGDLGAAQVIYQVQGGAAPAAGLADLVDGMGTVPVDFAEGQTTATVSVMIMPDDEDEPDEGVRISLVQSTYGTVDSTTFDFTIADDDLPPPVFAITATGPRSVAEGTDPGAGGVFTFTVTRTSGDLGAARVNYLVQGGAAPAAGLADLADGMGNAGAVDFAEGQTTATATVLIMPDDEDEPDEGVRISLVQSTYGTVDSTTFDFTIVNDDLPPPVFAITATGPRSVAEGTAPGAGGVFTFTVTRTSGDLGAARVNYLVQGGAAPAAGLADLADGMGNAGAVDFAEGQTTATATVLIMPDDEDEPDEGVRISLAQSSFGTVDSTTFDFTIVNDDLPPPVFAITATGPTSVAEGTDPSAPNAFTFTVTRTSGDLGAARVNYLVQGGAAPAAWLDDLADGMGNGGAVDFAEGQTSATATVLIMPDDVDEPDEGVRISLAQTTFGTVDGSTFDFTIADDDLPPKRDPIGQPDSATTAFQTPVAIPVLENDSDPDNDPLSLFVDSQPFNGAATTNPDGTITYTPRAGFSGTDTFFYRPTDAFGIGAPVLVTVEVGRPPNRPPVAFDATYPLEEDGPGLGVALAGLTTDPDFNQAFVTLGSVVGVSVSGFIPGNGYALFTPLPDFAGTATVAWTITDAGGLSASATLRFEVAPVEDPPVANDDTVEFLPGQTVVTFAAAALLANDTDPDNTNATPDDDDTLAIQSVAALGGGTAVLNPDGSVTFTRTGGPASFSYTLGDGTSTDSAVVTLAEANVAPTDIALSKASVGANLPAGAPVGLLSASDPNAGDSVAFGFAPGGNPGGLFAIVGNQLQTAAPLAFPDGAARAVTLRATDSAGNTHDESFVIAIGRDLTGTAAGEVLAGNGGDNRLRGEAGDDRLVGREGNDLLEGGAGRDRLLGADGNDSLDGGGDTDMLIAGAGADTVEGGADAGRAILRATGGETRVGLAGADVIDLLLPATGLPDGEADLVLYAAGQDGVDLVRGFEVGTDTLRIALLGDTALVQEVVGGTWVGFQSSPGGILLQGATGLVQGTDIVFV